MSQNESKIVLKAEDASVLIRGAEIIHKVSLDFMANQVTALIGASGSGKSTFLRCINRLNDEIEGFKFLGKMHYHDENIYAPDTNLEKLRTKIGMVFQKPTAFPKSIYENVAYGIRLHQLFKTPKDLDEKVESALRRVSLWDEVKDRLKDQAYGLSGGQLQRLAIARSIAIEPEVILMDEPCSALDPIATAKIEELIDELKEKYTIILVTHSMQQAARVSQRTAFFNKGHLIEEGPSGEFFTNPQNKLTQFYLTGRGS